MTNASILASQLLVKRNKSTMIFLSLLADLACKIIIGTSALVSAPVRVGRVEHCSVRMLILDSGDAG